MDERPRTSRWLDLTSGAGLLLCLFLAADAALIALHLSLKFVGYPSGWTFDLGAERGYGELIQYLKAIWIALLLLTLLQRLRAPVFLAWAALFAYIAADDWFGLHERAGEWAGARWPERGDWVWHAGELGFLVGVVVMFLVVAVPLHRRERGRSREVSRRLFWLAAALGAVGVGVDAVHHLLFDAPWADVPFTVLEDGGELVLMSVIVAFVFAVAERTGRPEKTHSTAATAVEMA